MCTHTYIYIYIYIYKVLTIKTIKQLTQLTQLKIYTYSDKIKNYKVIRIKLQVYKSVIKQLNWQITKIYKQKAFKAQDLQELHLLHIKDETGISRFILQTYDNPTGLILHLN